MNVKESKQKFFSQLEEVFIGESVKGYQDKSGYSNLITMKSSYYKSIKPEIERIIETETSGKDDLIKELYNKLYTFFESYLNDTGSPFFYKTQYFKNIYARVYKSSEDVSLFWKTKDLYYVKSFPIYKPLKIEDTLGGVKACVFCFEMDEDFQQVTGNQKPPSLQFHLVSIDNDTKPYEIKIRVSHKEQKSTLIDEKKDLPNLEPSNDTERKQLKKTCTMLTAENVKPILDTYKRQAEVDTFIHKHAKEFLQEQLDISLYHYLLHEKEGNKWTADRMNDINIFRMTAIEIIDHIARFENELKHIWEKPKVTKTVHYVITVDRILAKKGIDYVNSLITADQRKEWQELGFISQDKPFVLNEKSTYPLDTKYLKEKDKYELLGLFDDVSQSLDGELIKSDNWQALNTLRSKYEGKVKCIYIDPPYNTGGDGFVYKDNMQSSSWLTMMDNRLRLARDFLTDDGVVFISIDDNEQANLKLLCDEVFGEDNFIANICWQKAYAPKNQNKIISEMHDFILMFAKDKTKLKINLLPRTKEQLKDYKNLDNDKRGLWKIGNNTVMGENAKNIYEVVTPNGKKYLPSSGCSWRFSKEKFKKLVKDNRIWFGKDGNNSPCPKIFLNEAKKGVVCTTWWSYKEGGHYQDSMRQLRSLMGEFVFSFSKPVTLIKRIVQIATNKDDLILDFFAGSGTTGHAVVEQNKEDNSHRKCVMVEQGEHYEKVLLPRMKKVIEGKQTGISKDLKGDKTFQGGGFFKYYALEQYEETLSKAHYTPSKDNDNKVIEMDLGKSEKLARKALTIQKNNKVTVDLQKVYPDIDLIESIANSLGYPIKQYIDSQEAILEDGTKLNLKTIEPHTLLAYLKRYIYWES